MKRLAWKTPLIALALLFMTGCDGKNCLEYDPEEFQSVDHESVNTRVAPTSEYDRPADEHVAQVQP
jgi:hypothetical protein